jgi:hypothetical protein
MNKELIVVVRLVAKDIKPGKAQVVSTRVVPPRLQNPKTAIAFHFPICSWKSHDGKFGQFGSPPSERERNA